MPPGPIGVVGTLLPGDVGLWPGLGAVRLAPFPLDGTLVPEIPGPVGVGPIPPGLFGEVEAPPGGLVGVC